MNTNNSFNRYMDSERKTERILSERSYSVRNSTNKKPAFISVLPMEDYQLESWR